MSVALSRSKELGFNTVACASTGNLANSVAAQAGERGDEILRVHSVGFGTGQNPELIIYGANVIGIKGHYDEVNRLVHGDCRRVRLGVCEHEHEALSTLKAPRAWRMRLPSNSAGARRSILSCRWHPARC